MYEGQRVCAHVRVFVQALRQFIIMVIFCRLILYAACLALDAQKEMERYNWNMHNVQGMGDYVQYVLIALIIPAKGNMHKEGSTLH